MKRGTVVLTPFPFTDLSGQKVRPAVVVSSSSRADNDVVLAFITSDRGQPLHATDLPLKPTDPDFAATGLRNSSVARLHKLATVEQSVLLGELGELSPGMLISLDQCLRVALDL